MSTTTKTKPTKDTKSTKPATKTKVTKPAKSTKATKPATKTKVTKPAKSTKAKDTKPKATGTSKDIYTTWEKRLRKNIASDIKTIVEKGEEQEIDITVNKDMFPSYCRAKGMAHKDVVKAVTIVKSYVNDTNEIAADVIKEKELDNAVVKFKLNGILNAKEEDATHVLKYVKNGLQVSTTDGVVEKDMSTSVNDMFFGSTNSSKLFK